MKRYAILIAAQFLLIPGIAMSKKSDYKKSRVYKRLAKTSARIRMSINNLHLRLCVSICSSDKKRIRAWKRKCKKNAPTKTQAAQIRFIIARNALRLAQLQYKMYRIGVLREGSKKMKWSQELQGASGWYHGCKSHSQHAYGQGLRSKANEDLIAQCSLWYFKIS